LAYLERRALLAWALLEQQAPLVPMEQQARWGCLAPPGLQELQALTVLQVPPASLVYLARRVQPGSTGQQVLLELLVSQERQAPPESRAVMVLQALKALREQLVLQALMEQAVLLEPQVWELPALLALAVPSPSAPAQPTCCQLMVAAKSPPMMLLPIRSSSGTTARAS
jgi:hypothetical protein